MRLYSLETYVYVSNTYFSIFNYFGINSYVYTLEDNARNFNIIN